MTSDLVQNDASQRCIWTFGHSTRSQDEFIAALKSFNVDVLVDVRRYPGSKKYPHFNVSALKEYLYESGIKYLQVPGLGGRRKPRIDSKNHVWRNAAFRGYADYMESEEFHSAINSLENIALNSRTAYMCSEAVWWRCHRALISDYLKDKGWKVMHIMKENLALEHPYTSAHLQTPYARS